MSDPNCKGINNAGTDDETSNLNGQAKAVVISADGSPGNSVTSTKLTVERGD